METSHSPAYWPAHFLPLSATADQKESGSVDTKFSGIPLLITKEVSFLT